MIHLDTHVVVWLYAGELERFEPRALQLLESEPLAVSPMVVLELQYLYEIERLTTAASEVFDYLQSKLALRYASCEWRTAVAHAVKVTWTRDPFDRLIVASSLADGVPLLTRDRDILDHCPSAVWK